MTKPTSDSPNPLPVPHPPAGPGPHPGRRLYEEAMSCYNALRNRETNKRRALRLLKSAKALDFPAAHTSLANHFLELAHAIEDAERARRHYGTALQLLVEGGSNGHGRCWATAAEIHLTRKWWQPQPDTAGAVKYWKKYFQSQTFQQDDDTRWTANCCGVISFAHRFLGDQGFPRSYYIGVFLDSLVRFEFPQDQEIIAHLKPFKDEVRTAVHERLARYEKRDPTSARISKSSRRLLTFFDHLA